MSETSKGRSGVGTLCSPYLYAPRQSAPDELHILRLAKRNYRLRLIVGLDTIVNKKTIRMTSTALKDTYCIGRAPSSFLVNALPSPKTFHKYIQGLIGCIESSICILAVVIYKLSVPPRLSL
jgi:hypothetical protein